MEDYFIPLQSTVQADRIAAQLPYDQESLRTKAGQESSEIEQALDYLVVGVGSSAGYQGRPAHQDWPSYNLYAYGPGGNSGQFTRFLNQGQQVASPPALGANPVVFVHGLGSSIRNQDYAPLAGDLIQTSGYSTVVGFEYDTLEGIATNGQHLHDAYTYLSDLSPATTWRHVTHSMGPLVTRSNFEQTGALPISASGNQVVLVCGPHLGSRVINEIQGDPNLLQRVLLYLVLNNVLDFTNATGSLARPQGRSRVSRTWPRPAPS